MSTVLDAIKKSDLERSKKNRVLADTIYDYRERKVWPWFLLGLLTGVALTAALFMAISMTNTGRVGPQESTPRASHQVGPVSGSTIPISALSYSAIPENRFVFINGRQYREGDAISNNQVITKILKQGIEVEESGELRVVRVQ